MKTACLNAVDRNVKIKDLIAAKEWFESNGVLEFNLDIGCTRRFRLIGMAYGLHRIRVGSARMAGPFVVLPSGIEYVESEGDVFPSVENGKTLRGGTKTEMYNLGEKGSEFIDIVELIQ